MADIQALEASVAKATETVEKRKATIVRHEGQLIKKVQVVIKEVGVDLTDKSKEEIAELREPYRGTDQSWLFYEVEGKLDDIKGATRKLRDAETILANHQSRLDIEVEKERFLSEQAPQVIIDFLDKWKEMARDWHIQMHISYLELRDLANVEEDAAEERYLQEFPRGRKFGRDYDNFMKGEKELNRIKGQMSILGSNVATMATIRNEQERLAWLEKLLEADRKAKMYNLIYQVNEIAGTITDASYLRVNEKGNLDGVVIGEKGKAHVSTIGCGGYNIVCFHYRTNVYKIKE